MLHVVLLGVTAKFCEGVTAEAYPSVLLRINKFFDTNLAFAAK